MSRKPITDELRTKTKTMNNKTGIIKPNADQLINSIDNNIESLLNPLRAAIIQHGNEFDVIVKKEITPELIIDAAQLRKAIVKDRTGFQKAHDEITGPVTKAKGRVDLLNRAVKNDCSAKEKSLKDIAEHFINIEKKEIDQIRKHRTLLVMEYDIDNIPDNLGEMDGQTFSTLLLGLKITKENREKEEKERVEEQANLERLGKLGRERYDEVNKYSLYFDNCYTVQQLIEMNDLEFSMLIEELAQLKADADEKQAQERAEKIIEEKAEIERKRIEKLEAQKKVVDIIASKPAVSEFFGKVTDFVDSAKIINKEVMPESDAKRFARENAERDNEDADEKKWGGMITALLELQNNVVYQSMKYSMAHDRVRRSLYASYEVC